MSRGGEFQFVGRNPLTVVRDFNESPSRVRNRNGNIFRARVQRIFGQLFNDRSGAFDHFACGNLRRNIGR